MKYNFLLLLLLLTGFVFNASATDYQLYTQITEIEQDYTHFLVSDDCNKLYTYNRSYCSIFGFEISYELYNTGTDIINITTSDSELTRIVLSSTLLNRSITNPLFVGMEGGYQVATTHHLNPGMLNQTKAVIFIFPDYNSTVIPDGSYQLHVELLNEQVATENLDATITVNDGTLSFKYTIRATSFQSVTDSLDMGMDFIFVLLLVSVCLKSKY